MADIDFTDKLAHITEEAALPSVLLRNTAGLNRMLNIVRREALEEAALICDTYHSIPTPETAELAAAIRELCHR